MFYVIAEERDGVVVVNGKEVIAGCKYLGEYQEREGEEKRVGIAAAIGNGFLLHSTPPALILGKSDVDFLAKHPFLAKQVFLLPLATSEIVSIAEWERRDKPEAGKVLPVMHLY